jgi:hypothetical protein
MLNKFLEDDPNFEKAIDKTNDLIESLTENQIENILIVNEIEDCDINITFTPK